MMNRSAILAWVSMVVLHVTLGHSGHLYNFLIPKLGNYSNWLKINNLDPSPLDPGPIPFTINTGIGFLNCTFRNYGVQGHSDGIVFEQQNGVIKLISKDTASFAISFKSIGNVTFFGKYSAKGHLFSDIPLAGSGNWHISVPYLHVSSGQFLLELSPVGNLNISTRYSSYFSFPPDWHDVYFEGLWDRQETSLYFKELIKEIIYTEYAKELSIGRRDPVTTAYKLYWEEIFAKTTLADIIGSGASLKGWV